MSISSNLPFERISETPKRIKIKTENDEDFENLVVLRFIHAYSNAVYKAHLAIHGSLVLKLLVTLSTIVSSAAHLAFHGYLMFRLVDSRIITLLCSSVLAVLAFLVLNVFILISLLSERSAMKLSICVFLGIVLLYLGLLIPGTIWLSKLNATYAIISGVMIFFSLGAYGVINCISFAFIPMVFVMSILETLIWCLVNGLRTKSDDFLEFNTYSYKSGKSATKECVICLAEYRDKEAVCVSKCDRPHIFHEQCITEWLNMNPVCPICRSNVRFM